MSGTTRSHIPIQSIGDAAKKLRAIQRNWALYSFAHHRRAALIADKLPKVSAKPLAFGAPAPAAPLGSWTLIAPDRMLASPSCSSPFPNGEVRFVEDRTAPPVAPISSSGSCSRCLVERPKPSELCIDLGASPGGWTWVLQRLGARVISVDKAAARSEPRWPCRHRVSARKRLRARSAHHRTGRLAVLRRRVLSKAPADTGAAMARGRHGSALRLHGQVSRSDRLRCHAGVRGHPWITAFAPSPQQARADLG